MRSMWEGLTIMGLMLWLTVARRRTRSEREGKLREMDAAIARLEAESLRRDVAALTVEVERLRRESRRARHDD